MNAVENIVPIVKNRVTLVANARYSMDALELSKRTTQEQATPEIREPMKKKLIFQRK